MIFAIFITCERLLKADVTFIKSDNKKKCKVIDGSPFYNGNIELVKNMGTVFFTRSPLAGKRFFYT